MNTHFEIRIRVGVSESAADGNHYLALPFTKKFGDEKQAREFLVDLQIKAADHHDDSLFDFLQEGFGHEEFDICNLRIDGLFKITEEKLL